MLVKSTILHSKSFLIAAILSLKKCLRTFSEIYTTEDVSQMVGRPSVVSERMRS